MRCIVLLLVPSLALADGGVVRLHRPPLTVLTTANPTAGPVEFTIVGVSGATLVATRDHLRVRQTIMGSGTLDLSEGEWTIRINEVEFPLVVGPPTPQWRSLLPWVAWPFGVILLMTVLRHRHGSCPGHDEQRHFTRIA